MAGNRIGTELPGESLGTTPGRAGEWTALVAPPRRRDGLDSLSLVRSPQQVVADAVRSVAARYRARRDPVGFARRLGVTVGRDCLFVRVDRETFGSDPYLVRIGDHVGIAPGVRFLTTDAGTWLFRRECPDLDVAAPVVVGDNVALGVNVVICPGVTIGNDVAVVAGALVTSDVPAGSVVAGVPALVISDVDDYRERLLKDSTGAGLLRGEQRRRRLVETYYI